MTFYSENNPERMAAEYLATCELDAKNNPKLKVGMFVVVLNPYRQFVGHGKVISAKWVDECCRYYHDVQMFDEHSAGGTWISENVRDDQMEAFFLTPKVSREFKRRFAIVGGRA